MEESYEEDIQNIKIRQPALSKLKNLSTIEKTLKHVFFNFLKDIFIFFIIYIRIQFKKNFLIKMVWLILKNGYLHQLMEILFARY